MKRKNWYLIIDGKRAQGPLSTDDVIARLRAGVPPETLVIRAGFEPVLALDHTGVQELLDCDAQGLAPARHVRKPCPNLFGDPRYFNCAATANLESQRETFGRKTVKGNAAPDGAVFGQDAEGPSRAEPISAPLETHGPEPVGGETGAGAEAEDRAVIPVIPVIRRAARRFSVAQVFKAVLFLVVAGFFGRSTLVDESPALDSIARVTEGWSSGESAKSASEATSSAVAGNSDQPERHALEGGNAVRTETELGTENGNPEGAPRHGTELSLAALSPESLTAFHEAIESKLMRDPKNYARALLRLDHVRTSFVNGTLPSRAFVAAAAMTALGDDELDPDPRWRPVLEKLGTDTRKGLGVVAYENARTRRFLGRALDRVFEKGLQGARNGPLPLEALWSISPTSHTLPAAFVEEGFKEIREALERMEVVSASVVESERVFGNQLAARALWNGIQYTALLDEKGQKKFLQAVLGKWRQRADALSLPDRDILLHLIDERLQVLNGGTSARTLAENRQKLLLRLHAQAKILCQPREHALVGDMVVQTARVLKAARVKFESLLPVVEGCFVGSKAFFPVQKASFEEEDAPMLLSFPRVVPAPQNRMAHKRQWSSAEDFGNFKGALGGERTWLLYFFLSELADVKPTFSVKAFNERCKAKSLGIGVCTQVAWQMSRSAVERAQMLFRISEDFSLQDSQNLAFTLAVDTYTGRLNAPGGPRAVTKDPTLKAGLAQFMPKNHPENAALEWYVRNALDIDGP